MRVSAAIIMLILASCTARDVAPPLPLLPVPSESQLAWHNMEMNAFVHFTTNTFTNKEWGYGDESPAVFNPTDLDVDQWLTAFKNAGFKGVILTCKHHDGFCLWPSAYTEHSVRNSPWQNGQGDIVKAVSDACKRFGLKFGIYLSPWDRNNKDYGTPAYVEYYRNQLKELITTYGPVFEMWFDGANGGDGYYGGKREKRSINGATYYDWPTTIELVRKMEPTIIFFSDAGPGVRWVGNESGIAGETNWCTISRDTIYAGKGGIEKLLNEGSETGKEWIPAETDVSIRPGWFYHAEQDSLVKSPEKLFEIYLTSVGRGSTLLLNVPPDRRGRINDRDVKALEGFRALLDQAFAVNLASGASVQATNTRGEVKSYGPDNLVDGKPETYWATDDGVLTSSIEVNLGSEETIQYIVLQEYIRLGQRVKSFDIDIWKDGNWVTAASATTIGYKRILAIGPARTDRIRVNITGSKGSLVISNLEIY